MIASNSETMRINTKKNIPAYFLIFSGGIIFFILSSIIRLPQPVTRDDLWWLVAAQKLYVTGTPGFYFTPNGIYSDNPHLYVHFINLFFKLFGISEITAKIPGILCGVVSLMVIFLSIDTLAEGAKEERQKIASISTLLLATSAVFIQNTSIIDIDTTILIPLILLVVWTFSKLQITRQPQWGILLALSSALALWGRLTTPLMVIVLLCFYGLFIEKLNKQKLMILGAIVGGAIVFVITWYSYCKFTQTPFLRPFKYTFAAFKYRTQTTGGFNLSQVFHNLTNLSFWLGPFPLILLLYITIQAI